MENKIIYQSSPFILWVIATIFAIIFTPIIVDSSFIGLKGLLLGIVAVYIVGFFSLKKIIFTEKELIIDYFIRFFLRRRVRKYNEIKIFEIRNIDGGYQRPYVILHFNFKQLNSLNFAGRSFIYDSLIEITPLIKKIMEEKIPIKINLSRDRKEEIKYIKELIKINEGIEYDGGNL